MPAQRFSRLPRGGGNSWSLGRREVRRPCPEGDAYSTYKGAGGGRTASYEGWTAAPFLQALEHWRRHQFLPGRDGRHLAPQGGPWRGSDSIAHLLPQPDLQFPVDLLEASSFNKPVLNHFKNIFLLKRNLLLQLSGIWSLSPRGRKVLASLSK